MLRLAIRFWIVLIAALAAVGLMPSRALAQTWTAVAAAGGGPTLVGGSYPAVVFDEISGRAIAYGGIPHSPDVWVLENVDGVAGPPTWQKLAPAGGPPPSRHAHGMAYDALSNRLMVFGGCAGGCLPALNDVWVLTNANGLGGTPQWIPLAPAGAVPAGRAHPAVAYDASTNRLVVFGGQDGSGFGGATFPEVRVLSNANGLGGPPVWELLATAGGPPPGQYGATASYDAALNRLTVFAGGAQGTGNPTNAVWDLDHANGLGGVATWVNAVPEGAPGAPPPTAFARAASDAANNRTLYVGSSPDVWMLDRRGESKREAAWTRVTAPGAPPSPIGLIAYVPESGRLTVFEPSPGLVWILEIPATPIVTLKVNGMDPDPPIVPAAGPVKLTLDISASRYTGSLSWYWLIVINGDPYWITGAGLSRTAAPLLVSPPVAMSNVTLLDLTLPAGTTVTNAFFLVGDSAIVASDVITAVVGGAASP